jgi:undecaprenyl-phosphate galactose phosphotransferase
VILLGNKYKLLDEDVEELKKSFSSYYQVDADDSSVEKLNDIIQSDTKITTIVLNLEKELSSTLKDFLEELEYKHKVETLLFSDFTSKYLNQCQLEINEENLKTLLEIQNNTLNRVIKRIFDVGFSLFAIFISSPVMLGIAILIKLKSPEGGVFFTQKRLGFRGGSFRVFKFRTMVPNAEAILEDMLEKDEEIRNEYIKYRKLKNDPRIIPVIGNFLRKSSLDELPQFFNVLLGDMSVVGPRPYIKEEFYKHTQTHIDIITSVKPGVTGYWQVTDRNAATFNGRVDSDIEYVKNQNLTLDIKIIFQTVKVMVFRKGS